jgi:uncharacterized iron-regulated membrane protein
VAKADAKKKRGVASPSVADTGKPQPATEKRAFAVHGRAGAWLGIPLAFVMLTGALAVYGRELDAVVYPSAACAHAVRGHLDVPWSVLEASAVRAVPGSHALTLVAPEDDGASAWALVEVARGEYRHVFLDPRDGRALGIAPFRTPHRFLRDLHRDWLLGENVGLTIVTSLGLALWISVITGLRFWSRRVTGGTARRYHRLASVVVAPFLAIVLVTTTWYWSENVAGFFDLRASGAIPTISAHDRARVRAHEPPLPIDRLVENATDAFPELEVRMVALPRPRREVLSVSGHADEGPLVRELANQVFVHPYNGDVLEVHRARDLGPVAWWEHAVDAIHFGTWGGSGTRALWLVLGVAAALLASTGWMIRRARMRSTR